MSSIQDHYERSKLGLRVLNIHEEVPGNEVYDSLNSQFNNNKNIDNIRTSLFWMEFEQGPYRALKGLKSLEFDWTKFKGLKSLNFTKLS